MLREFDSPSLLHMEGESAMGPSLPRKQSEPTWAWRSCLPPSSMESKPIGDRRGLLSQRHPRGCENRALCSPPSALWLEWIGARLQTWFMLVRFQSAPLSRWCGSRTGGTFVESHGVTGASMRRLPKVCISHQGEVSRCGQRSQLKVG